jgi:hypothetical protein
MNEQIDLNEHHRRRLLVSCQYIDRLLSSIENAVADHALTAFPRYIRDINAEERNEVRKEVAKLRGQLLEFLRRWGIATPEPAISARHSIETSLGYIDIAVEELKPRHLRGYGTVPAPLVPELTTSVEALQTAVKTTISMIKEARGSDTPGGETNQ